MYKISSLGSAKLHHSIDFKESLIGFSFLLLNQLQLEFGTYINLQTVKYC